MAIYSTFFLCAPDELPSGFPGWQLPLSESVKRTIRHPFTGEELTITTREPGWVGVDVNKLPVPDVNVVAIQGNYQQHLENRIPPFVQSQPHSCSKNLQPSSWNRWCATSPTPRRRRRLR